MRIIGIECDFVDRDSVLHGYIMAESSDFILVVILFCVIVFLFEHHAWTDGPSSFAT